jgi:hypothetical protein
MPDFFPFLIGVVLVASPAFIVGFWSGAETLKNRHKNLTKVLEQHQKTIKQWNEGHSGDRYWQGYASGVESTLKALYAFLATFKSEDDDGTP